MLLYMLPVTIRSSLVIVCLHASFVSDLVQDKAGTVLEGPSKCAAAVLACQKRQEQKLGSPELYASGRHTQ